MLSNILFGVLAVLAVIGTFAMGVLIRIAGEDAKTLIPRLSKAMLRRAAQRIASPYDERYLEEWLAHSEETPELLGKLAHALTVYVRGAAGVAREVGGSRSWSSNVAVRFRVVDFICAFVFVSLFLPATLFLAILVMIDDGAQPFVAVSRVGHGGKVFRHWKLRTMVVNPDQIFAEHLSKNPAALEEWAKTQTLQNDPRVTFIGRSLRRTSLDMLPQFYNVLRGEMALVGPRARSVGDPQIYDDPHYLEVKPGITGFWQVGIDRTENTARYVSGIDLWTYLHLVLAAIVAYFRRALSQRH